jgi:hypothetical protein
MGKTPPTSVLGGPLWALKYKTNSTDHDATAIVIFESSTAMLDPLVDVIRAAADTSGLAFYIKPHPFREQIGLSPNICDNNDQGPAWSYALHERRPFLVISLGSSVSAECAFLGIPVITLLANDGRAWPSCPVAGTFGIDQVNEWRSLLDSVLRSPAAMHSLVSQQSDYLSHWISGRDTSALTSTLVAALAEHAHDHVMGSEGRPRV